VFNLCLDDDVYISLSHGHIHAHVYFMSIVISFYSWSYFFSALKVLYRSH